MSLKDKYQYVGNRQETCYYRFQQILDARIKHFYQGGRTSQAHAGHSNPDARTEILQNVDNYINCLRNEHERPLAPQYEPL